VYAVALKAMAEQLAVPVVATNIDASQERAKPRLLSLLFCDFSNITNDGKPNLFGVFDRIFIDPKNPTTPPFVVFVRVAEVVEGFDITIFDPNNEPAMGIKSVAREAKYTEGFPRQLQTALRLQFDTKKQGVFWVDVAYKGVSLGGAGLTIEFRETEAKDGGTDTYV
jgi:hypothetical protein